MPPPIARLRPETTCLFVCDVQDKFATVISSWAEVVFAGKRLVAGAKALNVPIIATEQNSARLGKTIKDFELPTSATVVEKTLFSMCVPEVLQHLGALKTKTVVIFGIETHICVLQTTLDLIERGYAVYIAADGCSSRFPNDRHVAFTTLQQAGAIISSSESILFHLIADAQHPAFKTISNIVKPSPPEHKL